MVDPGGGIAPILTALGGLVTAVIGGAVLVAQLFRQPKPAANDRVTDAVLDLTERSLESHDRDYAREVRRVHQLEAYIQSHNLPCPPREPENV